MHSVLDWSREYQELLWDKMNIVVLLQSNARSWRLQKKTTVSLRWEFDINRLCNETSIADNVVAVVLAKIQTLSPRVAQQVVLLCAACLGPTLFPLAAQVQNNRGFTPLRVVAVLASNLLFRAVLQCHGFHFQGHESGIEASE